jgi:hypothetical protein
MALRVTEQAAQYVVGERSRHDLLVLWVREIEAFVAGIKKVTDLFLGEPLPWSSSREILFPIGKARAANRKLRKLLQACRGPAEAFFCKSTNNPFSWGESSRRFSGARTTAAALAFLAFLPRLAFHLRHETDFGAWSLRFLT